MSYSLFQNIRSGAITKDGCESRLKKLKAEKHALIHFLNRRQFKHNEFEKKRNDMNSNIAVLEYIITVFDDLKLPLKIKNKPEEVIYATHEYYGG
jgi:hypothetical protein